MKTERAVRLTYKTKRLKDNCVCTKFRLLTRLTSLMKSCKKTKICTHAVVF